MVGYVAEGEFTVLVDGEVACIGAGEGPAGYIGEGVLGVGSRVGSQDPVVGWFSVNERLARYLRPLVHVGDGRSRDEVLKLSSLAWTVTRYSLLSRPDPWGYSKLGGLVKVRAPVSLMAKSLLSAPVTDQVMVLFSGSVALKV